ncbi:hypothetical protein ACGF0K_32395 [Streptomyces sp. NPDC048156]|uniref:hypothetical protein n=1 Tax=Streptomyces sp. NPDC048156 TaxID=3365502 RepID=UPI0037112D4F
MRPSHQLLPLALGSGLYALQRPQVDNALDSGPDQVGELREGERLGLDGGEGGGVPGSTDRE